MEFDFELFLALATLTTGFISLLDSVFLARRRHGKSEPKLVEYAHSFFPVLLIVLLLRSFLVEPFRIPTGSLEPTLVPGDFVVANKFIYGLRLPVSHAKILALGEPKAGDIVVFRFPANEQLDLIKRTIGLPGDTLRYTNKVLYINGVEQRQEKLGSTIDYDANGLSTPVDIYEENLQGVKHLIYINPNRPIQDFEVTVPPHAYFMMGDNRDNSADSRYWGFLPEANIIGKAFRVLFSWNGREEAVRWHRVGSAIHSAS